MAGHGHTQTDTHTDRQTGWKQYLATPSGGEVIIPYMLVSYLKITPFRAISNTLLHIFVVYLFMFTIPTKKGIEYFHQINTSMLLYLCINISLLNLLLVISISKVSILCFSVSSCIPGSQQIVKNKSIKMWSVYISSLCIRFVIFLLIYSFYYNFNLLILNIFALLFLTSYHITS